MDLVVALLSFVIPNYQWYELPPLCALSGSLHIATCRRTELHDRIGITTGVISTSTSLQSTPALNQNQEKRAQYLLQLRPIPLILFKTEKNWFTLHRNHRPLHDGGEGVEDLG